MTPAELDARLRRLIAAASARAARDGRPAGALLRRRARRRRQRAIGGLLVLAVVALGAVLFVRPGTRTPVAGQPPAASCAPAAFVPVLERALAADGVGRVSSAVVQDCRGGYARVYAVPAATGADSVQAFLRDDGGRWVVFAHGRELDCDGRHPELAEACRALGY